MVCDLKISAGRAVDLWCSFLSGCLAHAGGQHGQHRNQAVQGMSVLLSLENEWAKTNSPVKAHFVLEKVSA